MKIKINDNYENVGFWSFMKCNFLTSLVMALIGWASLGKDSYSKCCRVRCG